MLEEGIYKGGGEINSAEGSEESGVRGGGRVLGAER